MLSRVLIKNQSGRRPVTAIAVLGLLGSLLLAGGTALAVHQEGLFELDTSNSASICNPITTPCGNANTANDPAVAGDDWDDVFAGSVADATFDTDNVGSAENNYYTGGGSKDIRPISAWAYGITNDPVPDKDDIAHAFAAPYTDPDDGHTIIYFGMDRYDNNGDAESGFWFFKSPVSLNGNGGFTGEHTVGDILVLANWGGSNPVGELTVYQWIGGKNPLALLADNLVADCAKADSSDNFCAVVNRQSVTPAWPFLDKGASTSIRPLELLEGGIDVFALTGANTCFTSFLASTRSSHSTTAQLKDFVIGPFEECGAGLSTQVSNEGPVAIGTSVTDDATISVSGSGTPPAPTGNVTFTISYEGGAAQAVSVESLAGVTPAGDDYTVTSASVLLNKAGTWCFSASWPGDTIYTDGPYVDDGENECVEVSPANPGIVTQVNNAGPVTPGTTLFDTATISGLAAPSAGTGGTITFRAFGPDDATCATAIYTSVVSGVVTNGNYTSSSGNGGTFAPTAPGTYRWIAAYAPGASDVNNTSATTACNDPNESSIVQVFQPTQTTAQTWTVRDSMTITVSGGGNLTGTAHFALFTNNTCTGTAIFTQNVAVSGGSPQTVGTTVGASTTFTTSQATLYWQTSYTSTNAAHANIAATCTENSSLTITN